METLHVCTIFSLHDSYGRHTLCRLFALFALSVTLALGTGSDRGHKNQIDDRADASDDCGDCGAENEGRSAPLLRDIIADAWKSGYLSLELAQPAG